MDYLYDGSFDGFLTCVYYSYKIEKATGIYEESSYQHSIINNHKVVNTDSKLSDIVYDAIEKKISKDAMHIIFYAFLSCQDNKENNILNFIEFGFKKGKIAVDMYSHDSVLPVREMYTRVSREEHGLLGLLRFSDIDGILYAKYNPDNNITALITEHFADRYKYEKFIIHDEKRKIASIYANQRWEIIDASIINIDELTKDEIMVHQLWKSYFTTLAIEERKNLNLQFQKVPARYRKNIVEFNNISPK